ncbi:MAG: FadR/GntR family transcriptional regulator [Alphaproteobacteria bacterium]
MTDDLTVKRNPDETTGGYDRVLGFLRDQLLSGRLKTGDRLLPERELAALLGVGRPVLREALRALAMIGAVEIRHGIGTIVRKPDVSTLSEFFTFVMAQQSDIIDDVMEARIAIEHHAVRLACRRATQGDFDRIDAALRQIMETIKDPIEGGKADFLFHEAIVRAAHSPTLINVYAAISDLMMRSHLDRREQIIKVEGINEFLIDHHRSIFRALLDRDAAKADELLGRHFEIGADFRRRATIQASSGSFAADKPEPRRPEQHSSTET